MTAKTIPAKPGSKPGGQKVERAAGQVDARTLTGRGRPARERVRNLRLPGGQATGKTMFQIAKGLSPLQAHDLVTEGLPVDRARELMASFLIIDRDTVLKAMGISERTLQRAKTADRPLDTNASDRSLRLASVAEQAIEVLGSQEAAERWLSAPAMGLDQRRPIDLLQSSEGTELVKTLLTRMDYGVYA
jgi:putative toxin-antitoxin system antitoxin component (TIGR02293 family)